MKRLLLVIAILITSFQSYSQLLSWSPDFIQDKSSTVVTVSLWAGNNAFEINEVSKLSKGTCMLAVIASQQPQGIRIIKEINKL